MSTYYLIIGYITHPRDVAYLVPTTYFFTSLNTCYPHSYISCMKDGSLHRQAVLSRADDYHQMKLRQISDQITPKHKTER